MFYAVLILLHVAILLNSYATLQNAKSISNITDTLYNEWTIVEEEDCCNDKEVK